MSKLEFANLVSDFAGVGEQLRRNAAEYSTTA
jgi:hypothetical protein